MAALARRGTALQLGLYREHPSSTTGNAAPRPLRHKRYAKGVAPLAARHLGGTYPILWYSSGLSVGPADRQLS